MLHRHAGPAVAGSYLGGAVLGATASASLLVVLSGLLSPIPGTARTALAAYGLLLLALHAAGMVCLSLPERRRQIDRHVFTHRPSRAAFRFSLELGTSMRTYVTTAAPYALAVVLALAPVADMRQALLNAGATALGFGVGRSIIVASHAASRRVAVEHPATWYRIATFVSIASAALALALLSSNA